MLKVENLSKSYDDKVALNNVSFEIPEGAIFGLLGPNGAGKTTLIRIINRIIYADQGEVYFDGEIMKDRHLPFIGYLPEERGLYKKMKVKEQLAYFASLRNFANASKVIDEWLEKFDLTNWANKTIEDLSKGMQQKVQFINAVLHQPKFIILDEPFSGFDPVNANLVMQEIKRLRNEGSTILYSTHRMESVEKLCDQIMMINDAEKVLDGSIHDVQQAGKENTWTIGIDGTLDYEVEDVNIQHQTLKNNINYYQVIAKNNQEIGHGTENAWLKKIAQQSKLVFLQEDLPTINDVFIKYAQKSTQTNPIKL